MSQIIQLFTQSSTKVSPDYQNKDELICIIWSVKNWNENTIYILKTLHKMSVF